MHCTPFCAVLRRETAPSGRERFALLKPLDSTDLPCGQVGLSAMGLALEVNLEVIPGRSFTPYKWHLFLETPNMAPFSTSETP